MELSKGKKSARFLDKSDAEREMRRRKLKALEQHADFHFIIGPEKESAEVNSP